MNRISRLLPEIDDEYDAVVVGSGYGGGVAASRLARAGRRVCVLERGREILPGQYPWKFTDVRSEVQVDTRHGHYGDRTALFDLRVNDDVTAIVGCGLGGTSLINANVALEIDERLFAHDEWPRTLSREVLEPYYERARSVLAPSPYPTSRATPNKLQALEEAARRVGAPVSRPPINVNFRDQVNPFGIYQPACNDCGNCCSGCNTGAKNTTLMNYLPDAANHGAEIFTLAQVRSVKRDGAGWVVAIVSPDQVQSYTVRAEVVVLAAGCLGSTEILLRSRLEDSGLTLSPALGHRFSTNGDVLSFGYDNQWKQTDSGPAPVYGVGAPDVPRTPAQRPGPCITGVIDERHRTSVADGRVIEEGVIPGAMASVIAPAFFFAEATAGNPLQYGPSDAQQRLTDAQTLSDALRSSPTTMGNLAYRGPVSRTQTYLVMSHDEAAGTLELSDDRVRIVWPGAGRESTFTRDAAMLENVNAAVHGELLSNPLGTQPMGAQVVTVHPIGGCPMGDDWISGVVDDRGRVYRSPDQVHDGLYVCDGAVLPGALAVNPLLTITALAERSMELLIADRNWTSDVSLPESRPGTRRFASPRPGRPVIGPDPGPVTGAVRALRSSLGFLLSKLWQLVVRLVAIPVGWAVRWFIHRYPDRIAPGISFTETMHGFVSDAGVPNTAPPWERVSDPFDIAAAEGRSAGDPNVIEFRLTISTDDVHRLTNDPTHLAAASGTVTCPLVSSGEMTVSDGRFALLPADAVEVDTWLMTYDLTLERADGPALHLEGKKYLRQTPGSSPWTDLTTLYVTISGEDGHDVARGVMTLDVQDLIRQASTLAVTQKPGWFNRIGFLRRAIETTFLGGVASFFGTTVLAAYGGLLADLDDSERLTDQARRRRPINAPEPVVQRIPASDGCWLKLYRYCPDPAGGRPPVILAPGFSVNASSFATDTVDENLVEFLCRNGYDVWLFAYRGSPDSGSSTRPFTIDDIARRDWPAAVAHVSEVTGQEVQIVAHCVASMTVLMALLDGMTGVRSVICSQTTLHPIVGWLNDLKADIGLAALLHRVDLPSLGIDMRHKVNLVPGTSRADHVLDVACWTVPVPSGEACTNPLCRRVFALWGPSYTHAQLGPTTHTALREMFGEVSTTPLEQLSAIVSGGVVVDAQGRDTYLPNVANLALPVDFVAGARNQFFSPESSQRTFDWLVAHNGPTFYTRNVFPDYAHMDFWIGRRANVDIFPYVLARLEAHRANEASAV